MICLLKRRQDIFHYLNKRRAIFHLYAHVVLWSYGTERRLCCLLWITIVWSIYFSSFYLIFTYRKRDLKTEKSPYLFLDCDKDIVVFAIQSLGWLNSIICVLVSLRKSRYNLKTNKQHGFFKSLVYFTLQFDQQLFPWTSLCSIPLCLSHDILYWWAQDKTG